MSEAGLEQKYVKEAFDTNWVVPMGPNVNAFEADLEAFVNSGKDGAADLDRKVVCLSAGTAAVHLALIGCGVKAGDEVLVQSFTFCASSHPITYLGAKPVFVGSEQETWNMDPALLEQAILDRKEKTGRLPKAIVPVALYGMPYRIDEIMAIAEKYGIPVVEDAAEGMGSRFDGRVLGTFGRYGVLSFNGNKMITTSGGGALVCRNAEEANEVVCYAGAGCLSLLPAYGDRLQLSHVERLCGNWPWTDDGAGRPYCSPQACAGTLRGVAGGGAGRACSSAAGGSSL